MVTSCSAYGCTNRVEKGSKIRFHKFPLHKPDLLKKWVNATKRKSFQPTKYSTLCSDHFTAEDYKSLFKHCLKEDAVPSLFNFPEHLQKPVKKRRIIKKAPLKLPTEKLPLKTYTEDIASTSQENLQDSNKMSSVSVDSPSDVVESTEASSSTGAKSESQECCKKSPTKAFLRRKIKILQQRLARREKKISDLQSILGIAQQFSGMTEETARMLKDKFGDLPIELITHQLKNNSCRPNGRRYSLYMKQFAISLYFYSPRSYKFLRQKIHLPHPALLRAWVSSVDCYPGFMDEAFNFLKEEILKDRDSADCCIILDSMSIRKQIIWDKSQNKYAGYVDCGGLIDGKEDNLASEALVFMIVSIKKRFKCAVAYFLIDSINADVLAELIKICILKVTDIGAHVWCITADGASSNFRAFQILGCKFTGYSTLEDLCTYFPHPSKDAVIYTIFDPCHMLKLSRNVLAEKKVLSSNSGIISWDYLSELNKLQEEVGFKFANNLSSAHIKFQNKKMNVSLAAQTLSSGTADALEYLSRTKNPKFYGVEPTVEYLRFINRIFDILNSRNPFGKGYKSPLALHNREWWEKVFLETINYFSQLKVGNIPVLQTPRKMFALGFIITIKSVSEMAVKLLTKDNPLSYFLVYKVSQDHIELFFNSIRACGGYNNNPNASQFRWAIRKLLLSHSIKPSNSNCLVNDVELPNSILEFRSQKRSIVEQNDDEETNMELISIYSQYLDNEQLTDYQQNILYYIGGYIVKNILSKCSCMNCWNMLLKGKNDHNYSLNDIKNPCAFTFMVSRGGLKFCSDIVYKMLCTAEKAFKYSVLKGGNHMVNLNHVIFKITTNYLQNEGLKFEHEVENEIGCEDLHETQMTQKILHSYIKLRLKTHAKNLTREKVYTTGTTIRQKLSKLILFSNV